MQHKALAVAAVGLAAAGVVTTTALLGTGEREPAPAGPAAYDDWRTEIPEDFTIASGLPPAGGDFERVDDPVGGAFCGADAFPVADEVDASRDGATGPEYADAREVRLFADDLAAHRFLAHSADVAGACAEDPHDATTWLHDVRDSDLGEESRRIVRSYETDGMVSFGATWWDVVVVGNAVLLTSTSGEYLPGDTLDSGIAEQQRTLEPVVDSMCVFSEAGC